MGNQNIIKNASWIIVCRIVQSFVALVIGMISARYLGPSNYGLISYASSVIAFAVPIARLGLRDTLVEEIVTSPEREGETLGTALVMSVIGSLFGIIGVFAFTSIANAGDKETIAVCMLHSISLVFQMTEMIQYWYQAKLLSKYTSVVSLVSYFVVSIYKIFLLVTSKSIYWFSVTTAFDYLLISLFLIIIYQKIGNQRLSFSFSLVKPLLNKSKHYILPGMMVTIFAQTDKIMIKHFVGDAETGYYTVAVVGASIANFVFQAIIDSFRPVIFESRKTSYASYENNIAKLYSILLYLGVFQSIFFTLFAKWVVLIMYGAEYIDAIPILQTVTWYTAFSYIGYVRNIWMLAEDKQKYLWIINLSGAVLNVIINAVLIPIAGAVGAAIASVITQFFTNFVLCFIFKPIKPVSKLIIKSLNPKLFFETVKSLIPKG